MKSETSLQITRIFSSAQSPNAASCNVNVTHENMNSQHILAVNECSQQRQTSQVTQVLTIKHDGTIIQVLTKNIMRLLVRKTKFKLPAHRSPFQSGRKTIIQIYGEKENVNISSLGHISHLPTSHYLFLSTILYILTISNEHTEHLMTDRNLLELASTDKKRTCFHHICTYLR